MEPSLTVSEMSICMDIAFLSHSVQDLTLLSQKFLQLTGKLVPYEKALVLLYQEGQNRLLPCADIRCGKALISDYLERYHVMDYLGWHIYQPDTGIIRDSDRIAAAERAKTAFYQKFMKRHDIEHRLLFTMKSRDGELLGVAMLLRSTIFEDFSARELAIMELLHNHLSAAAEQAMRLAEISRRRTLTQGVFEIMTDTVFIFDSSLRLRETNRRATTLLAQLQQDGRWVAFLDSLQAACAPLVADFAGRNLRQAEILEVTLSEGPAKISLVPTESPVAQATYEVVVALSPEPARQEKQKEEPKAAPPDLTDAQNEAMRDRFFETLRHQYSLTKRELGVVELSIAGLENREIAERLHISLFTVKSHFQNSYAKLGVRSKQELFHIYMQYNVSEEFRQEFDSQTRKDELW